MDIRIDAMIIGAQKSGTSSVLSYLGQHPNLFLHEADEIDYFVNDESYKKQSVLSYYRGEPRTDQKILGKSATIMHTPTAVERLQQHNPKCKLILILRNPIDRAYSSFWYARAREWEKLDSFEEAINAGDDRLLGRPLEYRNCRYLEAGLYAKWIDLILQHFPRNQLLVLLFDQLKTNPQESCRMIYEFIGVDSTFETDAEGVANPASVPISITLQRFTSRPSAVKSLIGLVLPEQLRKKAGESIRSLNRRAKNPPKMRKETRERLVYYYAEPNRQLESLLGCKLDHWSA